MFGIKPSSEPVPDLMVINEGKGDQKFICDSDGNYGGEHGDENNDDEFTDDDGSHGHSDDDNYDNNDDELDERDEHDSDELDECDDDDEHDVNNVEHSACDDKEQLVGKEVHKLIKLCRYKCMAITTCITSYILLHSHIAS